MFYDFLLKLAHIKYHETKEKATKNCSYECFYTVELYSSVWCISSYAIEKLVSMQKLRGFDLVINKDETFYNAVCIFKYQKIIYTKHTALLTSQVLLPNGNFYIGVNKFQHNAF